MTGSNATQMDPSSEHHHFYRRAGLLALFTIGFNLL
jgi:hypothetical protein